MTFEMTPEVYRAFAPIASQLRQMRKEHKSDNGAVPFTEAIWKRWGAWLVKHICEPLDVRDFACIYYAIKIAESDLPTSESIHIPGEAAAKTGEGKMPS